MSGIGISKLPRRRGRFSPVGKGGFESKANVRDRDRENAKRLRRQAWHIPENHAELDGLADGIDPAVTQHPTSVASARYMRGVRLPLVSAIGRLCAAHPDARTFTIIPKDWVYPAGELWAANPKKLIARVRSAVNRAGLSQADGWALMGLHGEYNPLTRRFQLHLHGVGRGGVLAAVERLKQQRAYRSGGSAADGVRFPVRINRKPLTDLPAPLTYVLQSWWPCRVRGDDRQITPRRRRIPEPAHSEYLLWLDRWRIEDLTLLIRLRVAKGRLTPRVNL